MSSIGKKGGAERKRRNPRGGKRTGKKKNLSIFLSNQEKEFGDDLGKKRLEMGGGDRTRKSNARKKFPENWGGTRLTV